jgi:hypothetical protein
MLVCLSDEAGRRRPRILLGMGIVFVFIWSRLWAPPRVVFAGVGASSSVG